MQTTKKADALLEACVAALGAFIEHNSAQTRKALAQVRQRFCDTASAELGVRCRLMHPHNEIGRPNVTPARPIEDSNCALDVGRRCVICNHVVGAIHSDGGHEAT